MKVVDESGINIEKDINLCYNKIVGLYPIKKITQKEDFPMCNKSFKLLMIISLIVIFMCLLTVKVNAKMVVREDDFVTIKDATDFTSKEEKKDPFKELIDATKELFDAAKELVIAVKDEIIKPKKNEPEPKEVVEEKNVTTPRTFFDRISDLAKKTVDGFKQFTWKRGDNGGKACNHSWEEVGRVKATCSKEGEITSRCSYCLEFKVEKIAKKEHEFIKKAEEQYLVSEPKCTETPKYYLSCAICGAESPNTFAFGKAPGHQYVVTQEATCKNEGIQISTCSVCQSIKREKITGNLHKYETSFYNRGDSGHSEIKICSICNDNILSPNIIPHSYSDQNPNCVCGAVKAAKKQVHLIVLGGFGENANSDNSILNQVVDGVPITSMVDSYEFIPTTRIDNGNFSSTQSRNESNQAITASAADDDVITIVIATSMGGENVYHADMTGVDIVILADAASSIPHAGQDTSERMAELWAGRVDEMTADGTSVYIFGTGDGRKVSQSTRLLMDRESDNPDVGTENVGGYHGSVCNNAAEGIAEIIGGVQ